jgi:AraC-like DNA-binding protein
MKFQARPLTVGRFVQNGEFCFELGDNCIDCDEHESCLAVGYVKQLAFGNDFLVEDMDYSFISEANVKYQAKEPFIEILCLDSVDALHCERGSNIAAIHSGVHVHFHRECRGELRFSADTPIRGVRIVVKDKFFSDYLIRRFPLKTLDFLFLDQRENKCLKNPKLLVVFSQIKDSIRSGVESEVYYESKLIELLHIFSKANHAAPDKQPLSDEDMAAVEKARAILEESFFDAPKIAQLAVVTGTSPAKLQNDFKTAFGSTIHDYLQEVRMAKALDMIEHTETPLYIIANEVGCRNPSRFSTIFKETYGITPDMYRRNFHGKANDYNGELS